MATTPVKYGTGSDEYNSRKWLADRGYAVGKGAAAANGKKLIPWLDIAGRMGIDTSRLPKDPARWPEGLMQDVQNALYGWGQAGQASGTYADALRANLEADQTFGTPAPAPRPTDRDSNAGKYDMTPARINPLGAAVPAQTTKPKPVVPDGGPQPAPGGSIIAGATNRPAPAGGIITGAADVTKPMPPQPGPANPSQGIQNLPPVLALGGSSNPTSYAQPKPTRKQFSMGGLFA